VTSASLTDAFASHRSALWALGYRMLGTASDADDAVQDTFVRAMERPPSDTGRPWKPWLVRVLMNRCRDRLRQRRRRRYVGPWLPSPTPTTNPEDLAVCSLFREAGESPDARVDLLESVSIAFMVALEALTPQQRAVLVLRDVCDCDTAETAGLLGMSEGNVKVTLHRARRALHAADPERVVPNAALQQRSLTVIGQFAEALQSGDLATLRAVVADDATLVSDGGGVVFAANKPVLGGDRVSAFYHGLAAALDHDEVSYAVGMYNDLPAVVTHLANPKKRWGRSAVLFLLPDAAGRVAQLYSIVAPSKLEGVPLVGQTP